MAARTNPRRANAISARPLAIDYDELILRWMDHYVRGIDNGVDREKPVRLFVMGENVWRDEDAWPLTRARSESSTCRPNLPATVSARLEAPSLLHHPLIPLSSFRPAHPLTDPYTAYGAHDYRAFAGREDVLVFDTRSARQPTRK